MDKTILQNSTAKTTAAAGELTEDEDAKLASYSTES